MRNLVALMVIGLAISPVTAASLYGVASYGSFGTQSLYEIDTMTGVATLVGDTGVEQFNGIAYDAIAGSLYGYTTDAETYVLSLGTGAATLIADAPGIVPEGDLAFDNSGMLFTTNGGDLATLDLGTATLTAVGDMGLVADDVSGLAFAATGAIWGYAKNGTFEDSLLTIAPDTGVASEIGTLGIFSDAAVGGLDVDPDSGVLYLSDGASLYTVDGGTADATLVGDHGLGGMSGIAFVPEPASIGLLVIGAALGLRRRR
jgi:hypothetical protein